ncbi:CLOCK-interacting pacemaker isoform X2 [Nerophis lumbriciformis]|uniref:CLOCK-interacting pacemaker isoform X2 n=1 Tax=Nerophis lumbriciformis TaxID=546530 RepID=UPI002AE08857|nr:CLOCK-interacting pacemaker-like isoform X2 [Nerophis lumbriciformis]XP_061828853.1 CLOCK-interacting pacemaker-like isoform X2 [Nerophis lumbriciformis]
MSFMFYFSLFLQSVVAFWREASYIWSSGSQRAKRKGASMVKEELRLSERGSHPPSSKNAKDKSNSLTLKALRQAKDTDDRRERGCSSEKDSGYSDNGSDWQQTDVEDQQSIKSQSREGAVVPPSHHGQDAGKGKTGNSSRIPRGQPIQPIYIINSIVLKQPESIQKNGRLLWRNGVSEAAGSGSTNMILFQQPSLMPTALHLHKPSSQKNNHATYLPILNSYPRIAPHPSKKPPDKTLSNNQVQNLRKRVCTERKGYLKAVATLEHPCSSSSSSPSSSPAAASSCKTPPSPSSSSSVLTSRGPQRNGAGSTRHRRFLNTAEILRQSGLLDITRRTKELLRQSYATEREIAELREHTELLCQAADCGSAATWQSVHRTMAESSYYPSLKNLQHFQSASHLDSSGCCGDAVDIPRQNCEAEACREEVAFKPPDSLTGQM